VENFRPQRTGFWIGGASIALIVLFAWLMLRNNKPIALTPHDVKATIPVTTFTGAPGAAAKAAAAAGAAAPAVGSAAGVAPAAMSSSPPGP
jgi:hypothetical protein